MLVLQFPLTSITWTKKLNKNTKEVNVETGYQHSSKYLLWCSAKERNTFRFVTTVNDRWTMPLGMIFLLASFYWPTASTRSCNGGRSLTPHQLCVVTHCLLQPDSRQAPYDTFLTNTHTINREVTLNTDSSMHANTSIHEELIEHRPKTTANRPQHAKTQLKLFFHRIHYAPGRKAPGDIIFPFFTEQKLLSVSLCELKSQSLSPQRPKKLKGKINNNLCQHQGCRNPKDGVFDK